MTSEDIRRAMPRPEVLKMRIIADGLEVDTVGPGRLLVEPVEPKTKLDDYEAEGLIVVPKAVKEEHTPPPSTGLVIAVGDDVPPIFAAGTMVMFSHYAAKAFEINKKQYFVLDWKDIACTLKAIEGMTLPELVQRREESNEGLARR